MWATYGGGCHAEEVASVAPSSAPCTGRAGSTGAAKATTMIVPKRSSLERKPSEGAGEERVQRGVLREGEGAYRWERAWGGDGRSLWGAD